MKWTTALCLMILALTAPTANAAGLELKKGDHVCIIGNTLAERMQHFGWLETLVHSRYPQYELVFRNLGYSEKESDAIIKYAVGAASFNGAPFINHQTLSEREQRVIGFPQSEQLTLREKIITQGTIDCCLHARENGVAMNVAGGTHHAFADHGEGFCLLNDLAVAANLLLKEKRSERICIIDLDVHQGNGTAALFSHEPRVFTMSFHGAHNYPFRKERSDLDVPLSDGTDTSTYMRLLESHLEKTLRAHGTDFAFYLSGVDILETDRFGKLKVTMDGCRQRDAFVFSTLKRLGIPVVVAMGGGYSPDVRTVVEAHCQTFRAARDIFDLL